MHLSKDRRIDLESSKLTLECLRIAIEGVGIRIKCLSVEKRMVSTGMLSASFQGYQVLSSVRVGPLAASTWLISCDRSHLRLSTPLLCLRLALLKFAIPVLASASGLLSQALS